MHLDLARHDVHQHHCAKCGRALEFENLHAIGVELDDPPDGVDWSGVT